MGAPFRYPEQGLSQIVPVPFGPHHQLTRILRRETQGEVPVSIACRLPAEGGRRVEIPPAGHGADGVPVEQEGFQAEILVGIAVVGDPHYVGVLPEGDDDPQRIRQGDGSAGLREVLRSHGSLHAVFPQYPAGVLPRLARPQGVYALPVPVSDQGPVCFPVFRRVIVQDPCQGIFHKAVAVAAGGETCVVRQEAFRHGSPGPVLHRLPLVHARLVVFPVWKEAHVRGAEQQEIIPALFSGEGVDAAHVPHHQLPQLVFADADDAEQPAVPPVLTGVQLLPRLVRGLFRHVEEGLPIIGHLFRFHGQRFRVFRRDAESIAAAFKARGFVRRSCGCRRGGGRRRGRSRGSDRRDCGGLRGRFRLFCAAQGAGRQDRHQRRGQGDAQNGCLFVFHNGEDALLRGPRPEAGVEGRQEGALFLHGQQRPGIVAPLVRLIAAQHFFVAAQLQVAVCQEPHEPDEGVEPVDR